MARRSLVVSFVADQCFQLAIELFAVAGQGAKILGGLCMLLLQCAGGLGR